MSRFERPDKIVASPPILHAQKVKPGQTLEFSFMLSNVSVRDIHIKTEFEILFAVDCGKPRAEIFEITEITVKAGQTVKLSADYTFRESEIRKYRHGLHQLNIIINGRKHGPASFELEM